VRFTQAAGHPVLSAGSAESIGNLHGLVLDPSATHVAGLRVGKGRHARVVPWSGVEGFGADAVVTHLRDGDHADGEDELADRPDPLGARVLLSSGFEAGEVRDLEFDERTGDVVAVITGSETVDASRLRALGSYALVVEGAD
jgi:uncharacterized protein YrrD